MGCSTSSISFILEIWGEYLWILKQEDDVVKLVTQELQCGEIGGETSLKAVEID